MIQEILFTEWSTRSVLEFKEPSSLGLEKPFDLDTTKPFGILEFNHC
jgi:hypothetical protein